MYFHSPSVDRLSSRRQFKPKSKKIPLFLKETIVPRWSDAGIGQFASSFGCLGQNLMFVRPPSDSIAARSAKAGHYTTPKRKKK